MLTIPKPPQSLDPGMETGAFTKTCHFGCTYFNSKGNFKMILKVVSLGINLETNVRGSL